MPKINCQLHFKTECKYQPCAFLTTTNVEIRVVQIRSTIQLKNKWNSVRFTTSVDIHLHVHITDTCMTSHQERNIHLP